RQAVDGAVGQVGEDPGQVDRVPRVDHDGRSVDAFPDLAGRRRGTVHDLVDVAVGEEQGGAVQVTVRRDGDLRRRGRQAAGSPGVAAARRADQQARVVPADR